jgi:hypothetical protein
MMDQPYYPLAVLDSALDAARPRPIVALNALDPKPSPSSTHAPLAGAVMLPGALLDPEWPERLDGWSLPPGTLCIAWTGSMAGLDADLNADFDADLEAPSAASAWFEADARTWMPAGRAAFAQALDRAARRTRDLGIRLALRPHARHVLSDHHGLLKFALDDRRAHDHVGVLCDLGAMLTRRTRPLAEDHFARALDSAARTPNLVGVILSAADEAPLPDAPPTGTPSTLALDDPGIDEGPALALSGLSDTTSPAAARVGALVRELLPPGTPLVLLGDASPELRPTPTRKLAPSA